jgi:spermidine synthase
LFPHELLGTAIVPGHRGELRLYRHDGDFTLRIDRHELMSSRVHGSEEVLAEAALQPLGALPAPRVLLGGLGMGFTLARTLALVPGTAEVVVAELVPEVVQWNQDWLGELTGRPLADPRVRVHVGDVAQVLAQPGVGFDAILLDVDNGPEGLTAAANDNLYQARGLSVARSALRAGGVLAVWSSAPDASFTVRLRQAGFAVEEVRVKARRTRGPVRTIWVARAGRGSR